MTLAKDQRDGKPKPTIAFIPLARPTFDLALAEQATATARGLLSQAGYDVIGPDDLVMDKATALGASGELKAATHDLIVIFQATFSDSTMISTLAEATDAPLLMWALPEPSSGGRLRLNSLCGINLAGHALTLNGRKYAYAYAAPDEKQVLAQVDSLALAGRCRRLLQSTQIGLVGEHPAGLDTCIFDAEALKNAFDVHIQRFTLDELFRRMDDVPTEAVNDVRLQLDAQVNNTGALAQAPLQGTLSMYAALDALSTEHNIAGYAIRCWPEVFEIKGCAACGAMSLLNDGAIPSSCEADVNGTVTQLILQNMSNEPTFDCDLVSVDIERDQAVIWHCGKAPLSMSDPSTGVEGGNHSNRGLPLVMEFPLKPGRITIARLSQAGGSLRLVVGGGEMLSAPKSFSGTSGVVRFDNPAEQVLDTILSEGLEHHLAITYGNFVPALIALADMLDLPVLRL